MSETETEFNPAKVAESLIRKARERRVEPKKVVEKFMNEEIIKAIYEMKRLGFKATEICEALMEEGIYDERKSVAKPIAVGTLNQYLGQWEAKHGGKADAKPRRGRKATKPTTTARSEKTTEVEAPKPAEAKPKESGTEGLSKRLKAGKKSGDGTAENKPSRQPDMGGVFNTNEL